MSWKPRGEASHPLIQTLRSDPDIENTTPSWDLASDDLSQLRVTEKGEDDGYSSVA